MGSRGPTFVKICGITRLRDARAAVRAGANAVGFVFAKSPRRISPLKASLLAGRLHPSLRKVGVFVDPDIDELFRIVEQVGLDGVQLQGTETPAFLESIRSRGSSLFLAKVVRATSRQAIESVRDFDVDAIFVDTKDPAQPEAESQRVEVSWLNGLSDVPLVVAGGLDVTNVAEVVKKVRPWGVDVSGGVETSPGRKDATKVQAFVRAVREAEVAVN